MATEVLVPVLGRIDHRSHGRRMAEAAGRQGRRRRADRQPGDDKVSVEVPSPVAGVMGEHAVKVGDTVQVGALPGDRRRRWGAAPPRADPGAAARRHRVAAAAPASAAAAALSPSVRRAVLEHGVDPSTITGTGKDGRLTKEDVAAAASRPSRPPPHRRRLRPLRLPLRRAVARKSASR